MSTSGDSGAAASHAAGDPGIPATPAGFTPDWVTAVIARQAPGTRVASVSATRIGEGVGILAELYRLDLTYAPGGPTGPDSVIAKLHASSPEVRQICATYRFYEREVHFYREIAPTLQMGVAATHHAAFDPASGDAVIVMANLAPAESPDQVAGIPLEKLTAAIDAAAALHARWWQSPDLARIRGVVPASNEPPYASVPEIYRAYLPAALAGLEGRGLPDLARAATKLADGLDGLMHAFAAEPLTLCHGDFRVDNFMFTEGPADLDLTIIDWQIMMQARGPYDIGYLMGGAVQTELRRSAEDSLLRRYHDRLIAGGVTGYSFEDCRLDYRRAIAIGLNYWVQGVAVADPNNARAMALFDSWASRLDAAFRDLGVEALIG